MENSGNNLLANTAYLGLVFKVLHNTHLYFKKLFAIGPDAKPLFVIIGEGHRDLLFRYVESSLKFFHDRLLPRPLPLLSNSSKIFRSHLLFPGKVGLIDSYSAPLLDPSKKYLIVSDTGHHRLVIMDLEGEIKVS